MEKNKLTGNRKRKTGKKQGLEASLTVEAALVMSIVLLAVMELIVFGFRLHDEIAAANALQYSVEMYSHRNNSSSHADDYRKAAEDQGIYITGDAGTVEFQTGILPESITGSVRYGESCRTFKNSHIKPERLLRAATLADLTKRLHREE